MRRKDAGITLIETLLVVAMSAFLMAGAASAYISAHNFQARVEPRQEQVAVARLFEERITRLLERAYLGDQQDTTSYFVASIQGEDQIEPSTSDTQQLADTLIFTSQGQSPKASFISNTGTFEELNENFGPQGGVAEFGISTLAVGDAGDRTGLFLREQRPSDGDHTQGGFETVFSEDVTSIGFEFYDGTQWITEWDTTTTGEKRLPAAVRVTYTLSTDDGSNHVIVVPLLFSDVTPTNPMQTSGTNVGGQP